MPRTTAGVLLIGWDAAVDPRNTALSLVRYDPPDVTVEAHATPHDRDELVSTVTRWVQGATATLLCVDSPLGWPHRMAPILSGHVAGDGIRAIADELFRRLTDIDVRRRVGKTPLDVGADRIARTALATLNAIDAVRERVARRIHAVIDIQDPRNDPSTVLLLESYPAGWFASEGIGTRGYRPAGGRSRREDLLRQVEHHLPATGLSMRYAVEHTSLVQRADDLDALICTLNGIDYLEGRCPAPPPHAREIAHTEGWIWCKDRR